MDLSKKEMNINPKGNMEQFLHSNSTSNHTCVFCGAKNECTNFKGKCVCSECLNFVKEFI